MSKPLPELCPCGSNLKTEACCLPFIRGKQKAPTAEALLKSRYAAFVTGDIDYIVQTHHSKTSHEIKRDEIDEWSKKSEWKSLEIFQREAGTEKDQQGTLVFCAKYEQDGKLQEHWEQSFFERENNEWKFLDARGVHQGTYKREAPKVGRNETCPCGSGKKLKKCCG